MSESGTGEEDIGAATNGLRAMVGDPTQLPTAHGLSPIAYPLSPRAPDIRFDERGLVPVVVQEATTGAVLLLAYMNAEALAATLRSGRAHFWSRSRGRLWRKGERSGREQIVEALYVNCEQNSLLLRVHQQGGAACHTGHRTCYYRTLAPDGSWQVVEERVFDPVGVYGHAPSDQEQ
jgi:phosphoribosyl-AMP cyclohydrolase